MKSNAEYQKDYRRRQRLNADTSQINMYLPADKHSMLRRVAKHNKKTIVNWLCDLLQEEEGKILSEIEPDSNSWNEYFGVTSESEKKLDDFLLRPDRQIWICPNCKHTIEAKNKAWLTRKKNKHQCKPV